MVERASVVNPAGDHDASVQSSPHQLQYRPRRRSLRGAIAAVVILALVLAGLLHSWSWVMHGYERWQRNRAFRLAMRSCFENSAVPGRVVYEEDPQRAAAMLASDAACRSTPFFLTTQTNSPSPAPLPASLPRFVERHARSWDRLKWYYSAMEAGGVAFLGERRTPAGQPVLLCVELWARRQQQYQGDGIETTRQLRAWVIQRADAPPGDEIGDVGSFALDGSIGAGEGADHSLPPIRIFEGEADPQSPCGVMIGFERLDTGQRGVIRCEIDAAGGVSFTRGP